MSNQQQPPNEGSPSKNRHRDKGGANTGPRFRKNAAGNPGSSGNSTNNGVAAANANAESPSPSNQHLQHQGQRTQSPRVAHASAPPPRMIQSASAHGSSAPSLMHPHALHTHSPHPSHAQALHLSHSPILSHMTVGQPHSPHTHHANVHPHSQNTSHSSNVPHGHSPNVTPPHIANSHSSPFHAHGHSPSLHTPVHYPPPARTPTYPHAHSLPQHVYPSPSPRPRPMSMHAGMGMGVVAMGSVPGTPTMGYGIGAPLGMGMHMHLGVSGYDGSTGRIDIPNVGAPSVSHTNNMSHAPTQPEQSASFNLCRRRVVAPGIEGQSSAFAATVDPELAGIAVRVASPQPLLLQNGFLWEFEVRVLSRRLETT